jgi:hypothetical protein
LNRKIRRSEGERLGPILLIFSSSCLSLSCGYHAVYGAGTPGKLHVVVVKSMVPDAVAADEVASGVREELARAGALEAGEAYPRVEVEVLRADESSEGIAAVENAPMARGMGVAMVARAWVATSADAAPMSDTGDMRAEETITVDVRAGQRDPRANVFHHADALRAAARRLGRKLGARVLGQPAASEEN